MKNTTLKILAILIFSWGAVSAQEITNLTGPTQACQCDTMSIGFDISTAAFAAGNQVTVELSDGTGNFAGANFIQVAPLAAEAIGTYSIDAVMPCNQATGSYSIRLLASDGPTISNDTLMGITVDSLARTTVVAYSIPGGTPHSNPLAANDSVMLSAVDTVVGWTYQWQQRTFPGPGAWANIAGGTDAFLKVTNTLIANGDSAEFRVVTSNGTCDTVTNTTRIVYDLPPADPITNVNTSTQNCQCDTITVFFNVVTTLNVGNQFRVELSDASGNFPGTFIEINPLLGFNIGAYQMDAVIPCTTPQGVFSVRVTSDNPISQSQPVTNVIVGALPNTDITTYNTYTFGNEQRFCDGDTAILVGPAPPLGETHNYQWMESGTPIPGETNDTLIVTTSGSFSVDVTRGLCSATSKDTIVNAYSPPAFIIHTPDPAITLVGMDSIRMCEGTVGTLNAPFPLPGNTFRYQWFVDSVDAFGSPYLYPLPNDTLQQLPIDTNGVYYVSVTSFPGGCVDTSTSYSVFIDTIPTTSIIAMSSVSLCYEDSVVLTATDTVMYPDWKYEWQAEYPAGSGMWIPSPGDTLPWVEVDTMKVPNADTITFRLRTYNVSCEFITNSLQVVFVPDPVFTFFPSDSVAICEDDSIYVSAQGNALSYAWQNGSIDPGTWIHPSDAPSVWVEATGVNGCTSYDTLKVSVFMSTALITPASIEVIPGEWAEFQGAGGTNFYWSADLPADFNDRFDSITRVLPTQDTTAIILRVTGEFGCVDYDTAYVYMVDEEEDEDAKYSNVQNVITPNGDGKNDVLDLASVLDGDACLLTILDRWGREVYRNESYNNSWNGVSTAGEELPDGTYYYVMKCGDNVRYKGAVTIMRNENK